MHIHWFNPENDLALAVGVANYTAPKAAKHIHDAGALLPLWYAAPGDMVLCYGVNAQWLDNVQRDFGIDVDVFDHHTSVHTVPDPWGWSPYAKRFFEDEGFMPQTLPSDDDISRMRELSHRRTAAIVTAQLINKLPGMPIGIQAVEVTDIDKIAAILDGNYHYYLKHPWSGSGRGVLYTGDIPTERSIKFAQDALRRQGSIMVERAYDKVIDFARIYQCIDGRCIDIGTSVFTTDNRGVYAGNVLAAEAQRFEMVSKYYGANALRSVFDALRDLLSNVVAPYYSGVVGVDMLIDRAGTLAVMEINLRKTMGYVAAKFADHYLADGSKGVFRVVPSDGGSIAQAGYDLAGNRIASGVMSLTPPGYPLAFTVEVQRQT